LAHPIKQWALQRYGLLGAESPPFGARLMEIAEPKLNRQLYDGRVDG